MRERQLSHLTAVISFALVSLCAFSIARASIPQLPGGSSGQASTSSGTSSESGSSELTIENVEQKRAQILQEIERLKQLLHEAQNTGANTEQVSRRIDLAQRTEFALSRQIAELQDQTKRQEAVEQARTELENFRATGMSEPRPYSIQLLDLLRAQRNSLEQRINATREAITATEAAKKDAQRVLDEREASRRQAKEAADAERDPAKKGELEAQLRNASLASRFAQESVHLSQLQQRTAQLTVDSLQLQQQLVNAKLEIVRDFVVFSREHLATVLAELQQNREKYQRMLDRAQDNLSRAEDQVGQADELLTRDGAADALALERIKTRELSRELYQVEASSAQARLEGTDAIERIWQRRYQFYNEDVPQADLENWGDSIQELRTLAEAQQKLNSARAEELRKQASALRDKIQASDQFTPELIAEFRKQQAALQGRIAVREEGLRLIDEFLQLANNWISDLDSELAVVTWGERLDAILDTAGDIWHYEITSVGTGENERSITVKKILIGLIVIVLGLFLARRASRLAARMLGRRTKLHSGAAAAVETLAFYLLLVTIFLFALRIVNVPLTAFAVVGGALAIGLGFGSQTVVSNFIAGLILLVEQPIRSGDFIEMDTLVGTVERIGARATRIRTPMNYELIVPNAKFLEQNVINWTLSDKVIGLRIPVGVAYGSPLRDVVKLLRKAADDHGRVLKRPEPRVYMTEFGDNSLNFVLVVSIVLEDTGDRFAIPSELRMRIDSLFRDAGVTIAFPQRDVHLDTSKPIEIRVTHGADEELDEVSTPRREAMVSASPQES